VDARHSRRYVAGFAAWRLLTLFGMQAIRVIESTDKWGSKVVYGDTDSLFIYMPGKTKEQAFRIGNDIADTITAMNPAPIKLKFEKVIFCKLSFGVHWLIFFALGLPSLRIDGQEALCEYLSQSLCDDSLTACSL
jgi:hypothetical protein